MVDKSISILIVEDNNTTRRMISDLVRQLGFNNRSEAIDGTTALAKLDSMHVDFIISDWHMEPMTGLELLKTIRKGSKPYKKIPFLMVTAESKVQNIMTAKKEGVSNYIVKPFSVNSLKDKMTSILGPL